MATFGLVGGLAAAAAPVAAGWAIAAGATPLLALGTCGIGALGVALLACSRAIWSLPRG